MARAVRLTIAFNGSQVPVSADETQRCVLRVTARQVLPHRFYLTVAGNEGMARVQAGHPVALCRGTDSRPD